MDSITQITLGAAVGEAVLGRKVGNRAMLWGAVAGTIPDLDVIANLFMSEIDALAAHRGFSHSITFSVLGAILFGWLIHRFYLFKYRRIAGFISWVAFIFLFYFIINFSASRESVNIPMLTLSTVILFLILAWKNKKYFVSVRPAPGVSSLEWMHLVFWAFLTHPLLDSCTVYGTQLFQPFSNYRVAWNNISVADPAYTLPFILLVLGASFLHRSSKWRRILNYSALAISSFYLLWTVTNKFKVNHVMEQTLAEQQIDYSRYMTGPTILNNWLWYSVAESDSLMHFGLYSFSDEEKEFKLQTMPKNHHWLEAKPDDKTINILKWFCKDYYTVIQKKNGNFQLNDMRYGTFRGDGGGEDDFIFRFELVKKEDGYYELMDAAGGPPDDQDQSEAFKELLKRIKGI